MRGFGQKRPQQSVPKIALPFAVLGGVDGFGVEQICDQVGGEDRNLFARHAHSHRDSALGVAAGDVFEE